MNIDVSLWVDIFQVVVNDVIDEIVICDVMDVVVVGDDFVDIRLVTVMPDVGRVNVVSFLR
jgi:hypothetical protein